MTTSKERFDLTVNHQQPDKVVVDMGSTAVTGIHVLSVENLRRHYGLESRPVRVIEPYQMLGEVDEELVDAMGIDVVGAWSMNDMFGNYNHAPFKEFKTHWGQTVLLPDGFRTSKDDKGDELVYPKVIPPLHPVPGCQRLAISLMPSSDRNLSKRTNWM